MPHRYTLIVVLFLMGLLPLSAQQEKKSSFDVEKFKHRKAEFIKKEMGLTDSEAKAFIPLMTELLDKKVQLHRSIRNEIRSIRTKEDKSDADYNTLIDANLEIRTKELQLDKEYFVKFKKVLSPEKIYKYQRAESKFMREVVNDRGKRHNHR